MNDKQNGMLLGAFIADSLALGAHWVYDTNVIDQHYGRVSELLDPIAANFHPNRKAGEFTHYGDQMLLFYNYLKKAGDFIPSSYLDHWKKFFLDYSGYKDHAMQETLKNLNDGKNPSGSQSTDLSGVFYVPVLATIYSGQNLKTNVDLAVRMTHNSDSVVQAAQFLAVVLTDVLGGVKPVDAMQGALEKDVFNPVLKSLVKSGLKTIGQDSRAVIADFGQSCPADFGLPSVVHLIGRYEDDFESGLIENVMAGGDSAARGIFAGAVLGAYNGFTKIPERWLNALKAGITI